MSIISNINQQVHKLLQPGTRCVRARKVFVGAGEGVSARDGWALDTVYVYAMGRVREHQAR